jgi:hypothetical protein
MLFRTQVGISPVHNQNKHTKNPIESNVFSLAISSLRSRILAAFRHLTLDGGEIAQTTLLPHRNTLALTVLHFLQIVTLFHHIQNCCHNKSHHRQAIHLVFWMNN